MSRILVTGKNGQLGKSIEKLTANTEQTEEFIFVAREIFKFAKIDCKVNPIVSEHYPTLAQRPKIVLMNKSKISHKFDINILELRKSLESCIATLKKQQ